VIEPAQIRAARALLGWRQEDLSKAAGVGIATIRRIESAKSNQTGYVSTISRIQTALETAGILLIDDDGTAGIGVRLTRTKKKKRA
jgi:transcriptional regulator with XRE-family HTH domain